MTWLYVPGISSPSVPASEDLSSASCSPSTVAERLAAGSVTWRGKEQQPQAWSRRWKQGGFIQRLSGLTCSPSTLDRGVASFISSLRETPARTTALPASAPEPLANGSSLQRSAVSPKSAGLMLSSERTSRGTRTDSLKPSPRHWSDWATALRQEYSARPRPETPCGASDCSSWPGPDATHRVRDEETLAKCAAFRKRNANQNTVPLYLAEVAQQWEGPSVAVTEGSRLTRGGDRSDELLLTGQASAAAEKWASPKASDPEKAGPNMRGSKGDVPLPGQAVNWTAPLVADAGEKITLASHQGSLLKDAVNFRPPSSPDQQIAGGSMSSTDGPNSNQPSAKRKLNPIFVEALMRWPTGLSGFERQETAWTRWWLLMPSFLSTLCSPANDEQPDLFAA